MRAGAHWELSPDEAKRLNEAWANMARHFSPEVEQRTADIGMFLFVCADVTGPRIVQTIWNKQSKPAAVSAPASPVAVGAAAPAPAAAPPGAAAGNGARRMQPQKPSQLDPLAMGHSGVTV